MRQETQKFQFSAKVESATETEVRPRRRAEKIFISQFVAHWDSITVEEMSCPIQQFDMTLFVCKFSKFQARDDGSMKLVGSKM